MVGGGMLEQLKSPGFRTALIGLFGTLLTVCGGLGGALVTSAATVYEVQRQNQKVALAAPDGGQTLKVDMGTVFISRQEAANLDPEKYYVNLERGFILYRPLPSWSAVEEMTVQEQLGQESASCLVLCDQPVFLTRYGEAIELESDLETMVNGQSIEDLPYQIEEIYGPPPWKLPYYNQMILNIFTKSEVEPLGIRTLPDMILRMSFVAGGRVNRIIAQEGSQFAIVQRSTAYEGIRLGGEEAAMTIDNWWLFAEAEEAFYALEIRYSPLNGQSIQVWDDLQMYIDQFRVIQ